MGGRPADRGRGPAVTGRGAAPGAATLEAELLAAHAAGDVARLSGLYAQAAMSAERGGERERAAFYLTHAWVFALDAGLDEAERLQADLRSWGRAP